MGKFSRGSKTKLTKITQTQKWAASVFFSPQLHCISTDTKALKSFPFSFCINCVYVWCRGWEWFDKPFFPDDLLNFMMGCCDIFTQHMHDALTEQVCGLARALHIRHIQQHTQTLKALYILDSSVSMTKCAPSHTVRQIEPWFPLASYTQLPVSPHVRPNSICFNTQTPVNMGVHIWNQSHIHS